MFSAHKLFRPQAIQLKIGLLVSVVMLPALTSARAQESRIASSLEIVPDSVAFYWSSMNHAALWNAFTESEAYRRLQKTPAAVKMRNAYRRGRSRGWDGFGDNPIRYYLEGWAESIDSPGGKLAMPFVKQIFSNEIFVYGDEQWIHWQGALNTMYTELAPVLAEMEAAGVEDDPRVWEILERNLKDLNTPTIVLGALVDEPDAFLGLFEMAADGIVAGARQVPPEMAFLVENFDVVRSEGSIMLTWSILGENVPWESLTEAPDLGDIVPHLQALYTDKSIGLALGMRGNLLLFSVGPNNDHILRLGSESLLVDTPRLQMVQAAMDAGHRLTGVSFASADLRAAYRNYDNAFAMAPVVLQQLLEEQYGGRISAEAIDDIVVDVASMAQDLERDMTERARPAGPYVSYSFLQSEGVEGYILDFGDDASPGETPALAVRNHVGKNPALVIMERPANLVADYRFWRQWVQRVFSLVEKHLPALAETSGEVKRGLEFLEQIQPIAQRLDAVLDETLLPQIDGGSLALAIDLNHQRPSWFREMPAFDQPVPLPSVALAIEIDDPREIKAAGRELLEVAEDLIGMVRGFDPSVPAELAVPEPTIQTENGSTVYQYALPDDAQADPAIAPHARLADKFLFLGYLLPHTDELIAENELQLYGPAAEAEGAYSMSFFDPPQWVNALAAWVDYAFAHAEAIGQPVELAGFGDDDLLDLNSAEIEQTLAAVYDLMRCCRGYSSRSDIADGARRTHYLWRFEDLAAAEK